MIKFFKGEYEFLNNAYEVPIMYEGVCYSNAEAAFQAQKCENPDLRNVFADLDAITAKKLGREMRLREDWDDVKDDIMHDVLLAKFTQNAELQDALIDTADEDIVMYTRHDTYWGVIKGNGENRMGKILMEIRDLLCDDMCDIDEAEIDELRDCIEAIFDDEDNAERPAVIFVRDNMSMIAAQLLVDTLGKNRVICITDCPAMDFLVENNLQTVMIDVNGNNLVQSLAKSNACDDMMIVKMKARLTKAFVDSYAEVVNGVVICPTTLTELLLEEYVGGGYDDPDLAIPLFIAKTYSYMMKVGRYLDTKRFLDDTPLFALNGFAYEDLDRCIDGDDDVDEEIMELAEPYR